MAHATNLYKINQIYYFRVRIPKDLNEWFGKQDLKRSLRTKVLASAKRVVILPGRKNRETFYNNQSRDIGRDDAVSVQASGRSRCHNRRTTCRYIREFLHLLDAYPNALRFREYELVSSLIKNFIEANFFRSRLAV